MLVVEAALLECFATLLDGFCGVPSGLLCRLPKISDVAKVCARMFLVVVGSFIGGCEVVVVVFSILPCFFQ